MAIKQASHSFRGMRKDISPSKASPEYIIDALNIRLTPNGRDSLFSVTCERYPELNLTIPRSNIIKDFNPLWDITNVLYNYCTFEDFVILFLNVKAEGEGVTYTHNSILKLYFKSSFFEVLFSGYKKEDSNGIEQNNFLNFGDKIDSLASFENKDIQKVYWVDGVNQPRVINVSSEEDAINLRNTWNEKSFDFIKELKLEEEFNVNKLYQQGLFAPGVIQYCYTYFNKYGGETNIVDTSPLLYINEKDKGASPENNVTNNCFGININNPDPSFEYARLYSIHRTSLDSVPTVKVVKDIKLQTSIQTNNATTYSIRSTPSNTIDMTFAELFSNVSLIIPDSDYFTDDWSVERDSILQTINTFAEHTRLEIINKSTSNNVNINLILQPTVMYNYDVYTQSKTEDAGFHFYYTHDYIAKDINILIEIRPIIFFEYPYISGNSSLHSLPINLYEYFNDSTFIKWLSDLNIELNVSTNITSDVGNVIFLGVYEAPAYINLGRLKVNDPEDDPEDTPEDNPTESTTYTFIDNGLEGYTIDPTELLYKGGEHIIPKTISQKDGVLFLGNIALNNKESTINTEIDDYINNSEGSIYSLEWVRTPLNVNVDTNSLYPYTELQNAEDSFRTFKFRETYRIGIQCQTNTGKWLNPIYIEDSKVNTSPYFKYNESIEVVNGKLTINQNLISKLHDLGVKKIRPIIVYPTDINREIIVQGILNPTVFNTKQKYENSCDAQCSWLFRPLTSNITAESVSYPDQNLDKVTDKTIYIDNNVYKSKSNTFASRGGYWPESKHYYLLPPNYSPLAELPHMQYTLVLGEENEVLTPVSGNVNVLGRMSGNNNSIGSKDVDYYAVDRNIVTLHSPELEKKKITNTDGYKLRYVGYITCDRCNKGFNVQYSNDKVYKSDDPNNNTSDTSLVFLEGAFTKYNGDFEDFINTNAEGTSTVKPWWYNYIFSSTEFPEKESEIKKQTVSNNIISNTTKYFDEIYLGETSDIKLFDGDVSSLVLKSSDSAFWSNGKRDFIYKGNVNDILTAFRTEAMPLNLEGMANFAGTSESTINAWPAVLNVHSTSYLYTAKYSYSFTNNIGKTYAKNKNNNFLYGTKSPVLMKYNSTPHVVIALDNNEGYKYTLPIISTSENKGNLETYNKHTQELPDWDGTKSKIIPQWVIEDNDISTKRYLVLAELYREVTNKFGDVENNDTNLWYPAGKSKSLINNEDLILDITYGDTFFSRYDCLKTYPFSEDSIFNVIDIASFFVETRINTDLRYDNRKGYIDNTTSRPSNFNLFNDVYSQQDNFFNYRIINEDIAKNTIFPHTITWSRQKIYGETIDVWTNITMANTLNLSGIDGELVKIYNFNNELFCFQPKALNHVLYNSRVQINASDGVPIEIANSGRVSGFRKLSSIGTSNIRNINDNVSNLYFTDHLTKGIYQFNGVQVINLSDKLNFSSWASKNVDINSEVYVDHTNKNIYFKNKDKVLGYSETLQEFESFYSYAEPIINSRENSHLLKVDSNFIRIYNMYSTKKGLRYRLDDSYISIISNASSTNNKCFTNIEFKADSMDINTPDWEDSKSDTLPFTCIKVEDSHLNKEETLVYNKYRPSNTKKKFNTWRIEFPRVLKDGKYLRFNNPWVKTTLTFNRSDNYLGQEIHDLNVTFIE